MKQLFFFLLFGFFSFAFSQEILLLKGTGESDASKIEYDKYYNKLLKRLNSLGVSCRTGEDAKLNQEQLAGIRVVILPYNGRLGAESMKLLKAFVEKRGKIVACYNEDEPILKLLGIQSVSFLGPAKLTAPMSAISVNGTGFTQMPENLQLSTRNIKVPLVKDASVCGVWMDEKNQKTAIPAMTLNDNGAYLSYVYLDSNWENGGAFWLSLLGRFAPNIWKEAAENLQKNLCVIGGFNELPELKRWLQQRGNEKADLLFFKGEQRADGAKIAYQQQAYSQAYTLWKEAKTLFQDAYLTAVPSREAELRGVWIHSAYGLPGKTWDETIRCLADNGFNAIFVNMCWGYLADYESQVLPVSPLVATRGDQIELCLAACRKYGVQLHIWKVCWNMGHRATPEQVQAMQAAGRVQMDCNGQPSLFLAPHLTENLELEKNAFSEIVRKYAVDGIHLDYIRYPDIPCDYSESARLNFEGSIGKKVEKWPEDCLLKGKMFEQFAAWRRDNISRLVEAVHKEVKANRPDVQISAAVYGAWESAALNRGQDVKQWVDKGWVDFVCPMNYFAETKDFLHWTTLQVADTKGKVRLYPGIGSYLHKDATKTAEQILEARRLGGDGFVCFDLKPVFAEQFLPRLAMGVTSQKSLIPPPVKASECLLKGGRSELDGNCLVGTKCRIEQRLPEGVRLGKGAKAILEINGVERPEEPIKLTWNYRKAFYEFRAAIPGTYRVRVTYMNNVLRSNVVQVLTNEEAQEYLKQKSVELKKKDKKK